MGCLEEEGERQGQRVQFFEGSPQGVQIELEAQAQQPLQIKGQTWSKHRAWEELGVAHGLGEEVGGGVVGFTSVTDGLCEAR